MSSRFPDVDKNVFATINPLMDQQKIKKLVNCLDRLIVHKFFKQKVSNMLKFRDSLTVRIYCFS